MLIKKISDLSFDLHNKTMKNGPNHGFSTVLLIPPFSIFKINIPNPDPFIKFKQLEIHGP